jgi:hypothetical protein
LTSFDRLLLKMYYADNMRDHAISKKLGYHRNWIGHKRRMAIEYITKILRDNNLFRDG